MQEISIISVCRSVMGDTWSRNGCGAVPELNLLF